MGHRVRKFVRCTVVPLHDKTVHLGGHRTRRVINGEVVEILEPLHVGQSVGHVERGVGGRRYGVLLRIELGAPFNQREPQLF